jgi:hypothetical protein
VGLSGIMINSLDIGQATLTWVDKAALKIVRAEFSFSKRVFAIQPTTLVERP